MFDEPSKDEVGTPALRRVRTHELYAAADLVAVQSFRLGYEGASPHEVLAIAAGVADVEAQRVLLNALHVLRAADRHGRPVLALPVLILTVGLGPASTA